MKSFFRKVSNYLILVIALMNGSIVSALAQTDIRNYDIVLAGFTIGTMQADRQIRGDQTDYKIHSKVEFWFFGKIHVEFLQNVHYEKGQLIRARTNSDSNRGNFITDIAWQKDKYIVDANSYKYENNQPIPRPVYASTATLYFQEPKDGEVLMSENFGMLTTIREIEPHTYRFEVNGSVNRFYYENGVLEKVVLENKIKNYSIRKAEN
ncbi:DUF6134 family protein [Algoriphagus namhaensis]